MAIADSFLQELRERLDIESVVSPYVTLKRRGRLMVGLCPFHNEKTPSFTLYPETESFFCFGCNTGGEIITFIRLIENLDFVEAVKLLAQQAGMQMPEDGYDDSLSKKRQRMLSANREAAKFFHSNLNAPLGQEALEYLENRGISKPLIKRFGLGFAPDSWDALLDHMRGRGYSASELHEANLVRKSSKSGSDHYYDSFKNRIMIPIIDLRGNVVAFGGRILGQGIPKYVNTSDTLIYKKSNVVFALNLAKNKNDGKLILTEGYMDVIALHRGGFENSVACLGTALTNEQARLLARYAKEIILAYDSDEAGQRATQKALEVLGKTGLKIRVLKLSGGKDPDEIINKYGPGRIQALLDGADNETEYRFSRARVKYDLNTPDGRLGYLNEAVKVLADLNSPVELDIYASELSKELSVAKEAILAQVKSQSGRQKYERKKQREKELYKSAKKGLTSAGRGRARLPANCEAKEIKAEEIIISILLHNPDFYRKFKDRLGAELFSDEFHKRIYSLIAERIEADKNIDLTSLSQELSNQEMTDLSSLFVKGQDLSNTLAQYGDCVSVLEKAKRDSTIIEPGKLSNEEFLKLFEKPNNE